MDKHELAKIVGEAIKDKVIVNGLDPTGTKEGDNRVMYDPWDMNPVLAIMVETENGLRKGFTIKITDDSEITESVKSKKPPKAKINFIKKRGG